jgi:hypothetical protein
MSTPAGWYDDGHGHQRWWDGAAWTEQVAGASTPTATSAVKGAVGGLLGRMKVAASEVKGEITDNVKGGVSGLLAARKDTPVEEILGEESTPPLYEVVSHIDGKNAKVRLWSDRLEWERARGISGAKITAGIATGGMSFLATGFRGGKDAYEMLPLNHITSVANRKDGMLYHLVEVQTAGGTIGFRVKREDAAQFRQAILNQLQVRANTPISVQVSEPAVLASVATGAVDHVVQLQQLAQLRDAGLLSDDEFAAKKAEILTRM